MSPTVDPSIALDFLRARRGALEERVLRSYRGDTSYPSLRYAFDDFHDALRIMAVEGFGADFRFFLWDGDAVRYKYGLVNVAAFLAQATAEAVRDDACDELNWQQVAGELAGGK